MKDKKDGGSSIRLLIGLPIVLIIAFTIYSNITVKSYEEYSENANNEITIASNSRETNVTSRSGIDRSEGAETDNEDLSDVDLLQEYKDYAQENKIEPLKTEHYTSIEDVEISRNMDLTVRTGLSKEDFKTLISGVKADTSGFFYDNADYIYDLCEEYELNEIFFCGLISAESGWNIASNHRRTYNYISLMSGGKLLQFNSVEDGLERAAIALHKNYLSEGGRFYFGKTLSAVKTRFCPESSTWVDLVYGRMKQIL